MIMSLKHQEFYLRHTLVAIIGLFLLAFFLETAGETLQSTSIRQTMLTRVKDVAFFDGVRNNQLIGYGIVVGLNGTGDSLSNSPFTKESLISMLERLGINTRNINMDAKNVAAVMVTATLPAFVRQGATIDVSVSSLGSSKSLLGGTLLVTPLYGADGQVYAVAQGGVAASGFSVGGQIATQTKGVPTNARIANGAIIEKEVDFDFGDRTYVRLSLRNPDFTTMERISKSVNNNLKLKSYPLDNGTLHIDIPASDRKNIVGFMTKIEQTEFTPDHRARVVIDDSTGTVVMTEGVKIGRVAVAHNSLTVVVKESEEISQPNSFGQGSTKSTVDTSMGVSEGEEGNLVMLEKGADLQNLVDSLNAVGVTPRDLVAILQAIKAAGALHADLETM